MLVLIFLLLVGAVQAQVGSSALYGEARDESAALVPEARITARNNATGFSRTVTTGARGSYRIDELPPGSYTVTAEKPGFRSTVAGGVRLEVNQIARLDFALQAGAPRDSVTVVGKVPLVQTAEASEGYRLDSAIVNQLPLSNRNVIGLVTLGPGAIPRHLGGFTHDLINDVQEGRGAVALNPPINGSRSYMNAYLLDGIDNTDRNTFAIAVTPPMESVQEFRIQSSQARAEFAQSGGGVVDLVSKTGTQAWHGSAFEYVRNEALDARNYFDDPALPRPIFRGNLFGGSVGGPALLPSTFFFAAYEGGRSRSAKSALSIVPDSAARSGDFSPAGAIFDPLALNASGARLPFPGNRIPAARVDPIARQYLERFEPLPNRTAGSNYLDATPNQNRDDNALGRLDRQFRHGAWLFGRYTLNQDRQRLAGAFPQLPTSERLRAQQAAIGYTRGGASWLSDSRLGFTRLRVFDVPESAFHNDVARELGLVGPSTDPFAFGLPFFLVTNYSMVTDSPTLPQVQRDNMWSAAESVSLVRGRRTWKFGLQWNHFELNYLQSRFARGQYIFTGAFTAADPTARGTGDPLADFLLGFPQVTARSVGSTQAYLRQSSYGAYVQQDWRATSRLTLNLGLRYEYVSPFTEERSNLLNLDYSRLPAAPRLARVSSAVSPDRNNFSPRAGLAYRLPFQGRDTVFRAGYGIYYSPEIAVETYDLILNGLKNERNELDGARPSLTLRNGFPQGAGTGLPGYFGLDPNARTPYVQQWSASVQRELPGAVLAEVAYVGAKGTKLGRFRQFNTPLHTETGENRPPRPGDLQSLRTFPDLGMIVQRQHISNSSYHSLQVKAEKRLARRLGFLASFVWSKSIDDSDTVIPGQFDSFGAQDERNLRLERGLSFFNVGRRISAGFVYEVLSGWQFSGIVTLQDGTPLNPVYFAFDPANTGTPNRPNVVPGRNAALPRDRRSAERFFNTDAFSDPAPYTFGNAGRNILPGPGNNIFDLSLARRFRVREGASIEFRAETFNAFNHPNWGIPGPYPDFGPFFGKIFSTGEPRRIQLGLRLAF